MGLKRHIPNLITLGNLACGVLALCFVDFLDGGGRNSENAVLAIGILMALAMVFDFLDGLVARALKVSSEIGMQLDSLADMVTFGVLPGILVYQMLLAGLAEGHFEFLEENSLAILLPFVSLLIPLATAYRLAKFNVDTRPSDVFYGLPSPANAFFFLSLFLIGGLDRGFVYGRVLPDRGYLLAGSHPGSNYEELLFWLTDPLPLGALAVLFSFLLVSNFRLLSFKFKSLAFKDNVARYLLIGISLILLLLLRYQAVPAIMAVYFLLSFIDHQFLKK